MSLVDSNGGGLSAADVAAVVGNGCNGWGFGNNGDWWVILFLFAMMGNGFGGWGNGYGNEGVYPYLLNNTTNGLIQGGFDTAALTSQLSGIQSSLTNGFANAEVAGCNRAMDSMQTAYTNQIASMNQRFADSQALSAQLNGLSMGLQNCCCENRASIADLKYTVGSEACADRAAISEALRDVLTANTASTQRILDQMCADKIDAKNEKITELQNQLTMAELRANNNQQTQTLLTDNLAQTNALEQYLAPVPRPAYIVQNPNCCTQTYGCGCGVA